MWIVLLLLLRPVRRLFVRASRALFVVVFTTVVVAFGVGLWMMRNDPAVTTASSAPRPPTAAADARVVRVVDGDTIVVTDGATRATVRLLGIDTPEVKDRRTAVQLCGPQASARTAALLPSGTRVLIESDATQDQSDRYGRALAYVWRGEILVNHTLLAEGLARSYVFDPARPGRYTDQFIAAEADARNHQRGIWGQECRR
ncbi:nuclease (SNase domain protein) (plasmid) [Gordonia bronchialis DSM 43247]|uniref:Nuclease (SNase domain protein) n=1 Tax=Gordonia bronchialis (strain ATCC 25592 / DSM 43247 / BCRC 13721 / JCM 3198 / KCTC 3076 / NBRC 16047 / NCTC 10667) TaxID=526226 RepID=D0LFJ1_GORB4|nr:thermonuclease family protein [Gordonia bronchialis]ACY24040.1 nuclease (SNase domain protein) [Gordonia bronchialis DSM 43247]MCC3326067.1 thermonuclease family protein [Gordonia bronchialis]QGS27358.1 nuclease [Gordonia bronchialis]STS10798.1 Thermonuclease precursor [Gordonia bronchialis]